WVFGRAPRDRLWGTASPQYMAGAPMGSLPGGELREGAPELIIPRRIAAEFPSVRLVAVLRDPISRAISQHRMNAMPGIEARPLSRSSPARRPRSRLASVSRDLVQTPVRFSSPCLAGLLASGPPRGPVEPHERGRRLADAPARPGGAADPTLRAGHAEAREA